MKNLVLNVSCQSTRGIVAAISSFLSDHGCNIIDSSQFDDLETDRFFMRVGFVSEEGAKIDELATDFERVEKTFAMEWNITDGDTATA